MPGLVATLLIAACASKPPPPDWQGAARSALDAAVAADLRGDERIATLEFDRARAQIASTGRPDLLARAELLRCAARIASLDVAPCDRFERLRTDAAPAELAYADHLAGAALTAEQLQRLPPAQQVVAGLRTTPADDAASAARLQALDDPLSRLVGAAVLLQAGRAGPAVLALAVDTASAQGWRRPLLAWLGLQQQRAQQAGDADTAARLQRRIDLVLNPK
jgi:hypothetical protein